MLQLIQLNLYLMFIEWDEMQGEAGWGTAIYLTLYMAIIPFLYRRGF